MEKYEKGKKYVRNIVIEDLDEKLVTINHVSTTKDGSFHFSQRVSLKNVSDLDILTNAAKNILIRYLRKHYYEKTSSGDINEKEVLDANSFISIERTSKSNSEKTADTLMKLSGVEFISFAITNFGLDEKTAKLLYNKKHNL